MSFLFKQKLKKNPTPTHDRDQESPASSRAFTPVDDSFEIVEDTPPTLLTGTLNQQSPNHHYYFDLILFLHAGRSQVRPTKLPSDTDHAHDEVNVSTSYRQVLESSDDDGSVEDDHRHRIISSDDSDDDIPLVSKHTKGGEDTEDWVSEDEDAPEDEENVSEDGSEELSELSAQQNPAAGKYSFCTTSAI